MATDYAASRPEYPDALFDWIASAAPASQCAWDVGCGSGQSSRGLAAHFVRVHASDPSAAQIAQASAPANVAFATEAGEQCGLPDNSVDAVCVAQALHWFDRTAFFGECTRVLRPGGILVAWGYQDIEVPDVLATANAALQDDIRQWWPPERALIDNAYAGFDWPFAVLDAPAFELHAQWTLPRLLGYFSSYSASKNCRETTGRDPVAAHASAFTASWGDPATTQSVRWPMFLHARRKAA